MAEVSAKDVAALRKQTGAGMMDCKTALSETGGDLEAARDWLRERNLAGASKRAGREAVDGAVAVLVEGKVGVVVELTCETDFVAKGSDFSHLVEALSRVALESDADGLASQPFEGSTVGETVAELSGKLGEKIELGRVARFETANGLVDGYKHNQNERGVIGVLVELGGVNPSDAKAAEVAHDIALHIASAAPLYLSRDDVPADVVAHEREVFEALTRNEGKPEPAIPKIIEGRLTGFYKDTVLLEQGFVREPKTSVSSLIASLGPEAMVRRIARIKVGEA